MISIPLGETNMNEKITPLLRVVVAVLYLYINIDTRKYIQDKGKTRLISSCKLNDCIQQRTQPTTARNVRFV